MTHLQEDNSERRKDIEQNLLLEALFQLYDADFRNYDQQVVRHKISSFMASCNYRTLSSLLAAAADDPAIAQQLCQALLAHSGGLYDNAIEFVALRTLIAGSLGSYPAPKVWLAECLSAEDVFGFAILLAEEELLDRTLLFATCSNETLLQEIMEGSFPLDRVEVYERQYRQAGGRRAFHEYIVERDGRAEFKCELRSRIIWAQYHLGTDSSFNEFQLISCRRSFRDFNLDLARRVLRLFHDSLSHFGLLNVPVQHDISRFPVLTQYRAMQTRGIYRRTL